MYTLVFLVYAGMLAKGDSVALHSVPGWQTPAACEAAGKQLEKLVKSTYKDVNFVCLKAN